MDAIEFVSKLVGIAGGVVGIATGLTTLREKRKPSATQTDHPPPTPTGTPPSPTARQPTAQPPPPAESLPGEPVVRRKNYTTIFAIIGFISAFFCGPVGVVFSLLSLLEARRTRSSFVLPWIALAFTVAISILVVAVFRPSGE